MGIRPFYQRHVVGNLTRHGPNGTVKLPDGVQHPALFEEGFRV